ncbi:MAG: nitrile hydratase accessory protein [Pseudomonadota bacterium]
MTGSRSSTVETGPTFAAPWEAAAFALKAHLTETGRLDATRFAAVFGEELRKDHQAADDGTAYFVAFVTALERTIVGLASDDELAREVAAWHRAAASTPHGQPITLDK